MRDLLTAIASLVILVLAAALVAPPLIDWEARRDLIDRTLSQAAGTPARTDGRIEVRLLPSPRVRVDSLQLGGEEPDTAAVSARYVKAGVALTPLLRGEVRFTDTRVGRIEVRVPTRTGADWRLPPDAAARLRRDWAFDDLFVNQLLVTTVAPTTGRTDQFYLENVSVEAQSLAGPWRVEALAGGLVPFRLVTGALAADQTIQAKLSGGGDLYPRFDVDARLALGAGPEPSLVPSATGTAKILFGPPAQAGTAGLPLPVAVQSPFKTTGQEVDFEKLTVEAGDGSASLRLAGSARIGFEQPKAMVKLEGRRLDLDSFILSPVGQELTARLGAWSPPPLAWPIELDLALNSVLLAQEELSNVTARIALQRGRARIERVEAGAPGQTLVALSGEVGLATEGGGSGQVSIVSPASDRFARYLGKLGVDARWLTPLDGRRLEAAADVALANPITSFRNVRVKLGDALLTGNARRTAPEGAARGRLEAQVSLQGIDLAQLPPLNSVFDASRDLDVGLILDARDVRHGGQAGAGRIAARIVSDGPALLVETLDIVNLAGANARVSGRIAPDGSGRITGRVAASRAAPLVDLIGTVWVGGVAKLTPAFLREGDLNLDVVAERAPSAEPKPGDGPLRLRTTARGTAAGGLFEADILSASGTTESLNLKLATDNTGRWVDRPNAPLLRRPSNLELRGVRVGSGQFNLTATGDVAGLRVATTRPFALASGDDIVDSGEADLTAADITPFLVLLGDGAGVTPPVPLQLRVGFGRERDQSQLSIAGRIAGEGVQARLTAGSRADVTGTVTIDRVSLPWIANALALGMPADQRATGGAWAGTRFGQTRRLIDGGQVEIRARRLDLGRGYGGENASLLLGVNPEGGVAFRNLDMGLAGGRLTGTVSVGRQGALGSVSGDVTLRDAALPQVIGSSSPFDGRLSGTLRFGSAGESPSGLVANLAGSGDLRLAPFAVLNADPAAVERTVRRALTDPDPLAAGRLQAIAVEELAKGPFRAQAVAAPLSLVGGVLRASPVSADAGSAAWQGSLALDWKTLALEARGILTARTSPKGWTGNPPFLALTFRGPLADPARDVDVGPLTGGVTAIVLQRELEKIEAFEAEANERARLNQRRDMDRARRAAEAEAARRATEEAARRAAEEIAARKAAEEAARRNEELARQARLREKQAAEEAARQARLREQQEAEEAARQARLRERQAVEDARQARLREQAAAAERARSGFEIPPRTEQPIPLPRPPLDISPGAYRAQPGP